MPAEAAAAAGPRDLAPKRTALMACILSSSLVGMDGMMTPVALPDLADDLNAGLAVQQWVVAAFLLALGSLLLVGGALGDVVDRWRIFAAGAAGFGASALVVAVAPTASLLVAGRLAQGATAALLVPGALAVITTTFEGDERSRAIGSWTAWSGLSVIGGPLAGGVLVDVVSWRAVYGVLVPMAALTLFFILRATPRGAREAQAGSVDWGGALLTVPAVGGPVFALIEGPGSGWGSRLVVGALVAGAAAIAGLAWWEPRACDPLLPVRLLQVPAFMTLNAVTLVLYGALISSGFYTVLFLQQTAGYPPAAAGLAAAVPVVVLLVLSRRFGALADRHGPRRFIVGGALVVAAGILLMLRTDAHADFLSVVLPSVLVHGVGLAMLVAPLTSTVLSAAPDGLTGAASGMNNAVARIGSLLGTVAVGLVVSATFPAALDDHGLPPAVVRQAEDRPLASTPSADVPVSERARVREVLSAASVDAFHVAVGAMGGLALLAAMIGAVGARRPRGRFAAARVPGGALHGAHHDLD
ncbi:MFS family permease [Actinomadura coerulea]|uniref:MFS family permease n=1 Tax=Actinomadura coerulea TaxID=46159 RepID=A0A7X0G5A4_9ACTN|nr:MFS transporter [Actinomadura coerulea]MBB6399755.1 MFS family permease [Actinomadura coerulea]GGQ45164.1 MFS transporter [Actinomadura coerulea]